MRRIVFALFGVMTIVRTSSALSAEPVPSDARAGFEIYTTVPVACRPLPPWYPRGWELVVHTPCPAGYYLPHPFHQAGYRHWHAHPDYRPYVPGPIDHRPYLRPGWWW